MRRASPTVGCPLVRCARKFARGVAQNATPMSQWEFAIRRTHCAGTRASLESTAKDKLNEILRWTKMDKRMLYQLPQPPAHIGPSHAPPAVAIYNKVPMNDQSPSAVVTPRSHGQRTKSSDKNARSEAGTAVDVLLVVADVTFVVDLQLLQGGEIRAGIEASA
jgi:hypothetical protein